MRKNPTVITVTNQKGGVAKTTTSVNLAASIAASNLSVCLIDLDYQCNATSLVGMQTYALKHKTDIDKVLREQKPLEECIIETDKGFDLIPGSMGLSTFWQLCISDIGKLFSLRKLMQENLTMAEYDVVIIDTHPSLDSLLDLALHASNFFLIPIFAEIDAFSGINYLMDKIQTVKKVDNHSARLKSMGAVLTRFDKTSSTHKKFLHFLTTKTNNDVFRIRSIIPQSQAVAGASAVHKTLLEYGKALSVTQAYLELAEEIIKDFSMSFEDKNTQASASSDSHDYMADYLSFNEQETDFDFE